MLSNQYQYKRSTPNSTSGKTDGSKGVHLSDNRGLSNPVQRKSNNTGLPDNLKKQGGVKPTMQLKSKVNVNDDHSLETEADRMGSKALQFSGKENATVLQRGPSSDTAQCTSIKVVAEGLTQTMKENFEKAYAQFNNTILAASPLTTEANNHVVIHAVSKKTHGMDAYATTILYIGKDGYKGDDYDEFAGLWNTKLENEIPNDVAVRIVITVNMTRHAGEKQLYTTLLHEWYAHAIHWTDVIESIRKGTGKDTVKNVQEIGSKKREIDEHQKYSNFKKSRLEEMTDNLGLKDQNKTDVVKKLETDQNEYNKETGEIN